MIQGNNLFDCNASFWMKKKLRNQEWVENMIAWPDNFTRLSCRAVDWYGYVESWSDGIERSWRNGKNRTCCYGNHQKLSEKSMSFRSCLCKIQISGRNNGLWLLKYDDDEGRGSPFSIQRTKPDKTLETINGWIKTVCLGVERKQVLCIKLCCICVC